MASSKFDPSPQNKAQERRFGGILPRLFFATPYVLLLILFHGLDVYHRHFSDIGIIVLVYNSFRVLFIFYLFWTVQTAGALLLKIVDRKAYEQIDVLERVVLGVFAGTAIWHAAMLGLGYLNLYTVPVAIILTLPLVVLSYAEARTAAIEFCRTVVRSGGLSGESEFGMPGWFILGLIGLTFVVLLLVKGLYPGGGHDYFTHYFYYFQTVIDRHGLWPNDVWYHYYYDKGAGLDFLGILITDPLAPQLVTFCFVSAAVMALYFILRRIAHGTLWPLAGVALYLGIYIYTPGSAVLYRNNGGWGEFEKLHEINATLVIAVFWTTLEALSAVSRVRLLWIIGAAASVFTAVIVNITAASFLGCIFALLAIFYAIRRRFGDVLLCIGLGAVAGGVLVATLLLNQLTTGLANDQGINLFWNFANIERLAQWGALPYVILLHHDYQGMLLQSMSLSYHTVTFLLQSSRTDLVAPLVIGGLIVAYPAMRQRRWNRSVETAAVLTAATALAFVILALLFGRAQQVSFYRYATFETAPTIIFGILLWSLVPLESSWSRIARSGSIAVAVLVLCLVIDIYPRQMVNAVSRGLHFALGAYSIDTAYQNQYGPAPRSIWTAIWPGSRGAYETVGPGTPIWSFHIHSYCMLPDCRVESYPSFIMTPQWDRIMFGPADEAKRILQAGNFNYFLYSRELGIRDPLPLSQLFAPDNIGQYLGIRWTDGTNVLLTWLGPGIQPLDQSWLASYRQAVAESGTVQSFPYDAMKQIYSGLNASPHPSQRLRLPWQTN